MWYDFGSRAKGAKLVAGDRIVIKSHVYNSLTRIEEDHILTGTVLPSKSKIVLLDREFRRAFTQYSFSIALQKRFREFYNGTEHRFYYVSNLGGQFRLLSRDPKYALYLLMKHNIRPPENIDWLVHLNVPDVGAVSPTKQA